MERYIQFMVKIAPVILRIGLALVFFWFGSNQLGNPSQWTSFLPAWSAALPISATKLILMNGLFEIVAGALLLLGAWTRIAALLLALHLFGIAFTIGLNSIGVRDFGLAIATFAIFLYGSGTFSVDESSKNSRENIQDAT